MTDDLGVVIHGFYYTIIDPDIEVCEDSFFMTPEHPGEISERFQPAVSCPPEPAFQILSCPDFACILPQPPEQLFEKGSPYDFEIAFKEVREPDLLVLCEVPGIFQPDVFGPFKFFAPCFGQCIGLHFSDLINRLHEMANNMELVKHNHGLATILMNNIDVVLPHVTTDTLDSGGAFFSPPFEESAKGVFVSVSTTPYEPFSLQIIHIGVVGMTLLSADLINADEPDPLVGLPLSSILHSRFHGCSDRIPGDVEKLGHLIPGQHPCPEGQNRDQGETQRLFPQAPGNTLHSDPMFRTFHSPGPVAKKDRDTPEGNMSPAPLFEFILGADASPAETARQLTPLFGPKFDPQFVTGKISRNYTMVLDSERKTYDTFNEHESTSVPGILANTLTNGFGSCFQVFNP